MGVPGAGRSIGRLQAPYSLAALTKAIGAASIAPLDVADAPARLGARLPRLRARAALFESTKSATRGTISARNRDPLNTPQRPTSRCSQCHLRVGGSVKTVPSGRFGTASD